jgi:purine-cytosine permease-like protein
MLRVLRAMVLPFVILLVLLAALTLGKAHLGGGHNGSWQSMMEGLAFVLSAGGYGWLMNSNDFSRYLPEKTSEKKTIWSVALGGFIPTTLCLLLGAAIATTAGSNAEGATSLTGSFASWFFWPYLIFVLFQVFAINSLDLYTSGLTLQAIIPKIKRWQCVLLDTIIATGLTAWAEFNSSFSTFISDFILFMLIWIAPWVAIFLVDYFLRRGKYDSPGLMETAKGIYYRNGGFNWRGLLAMGIGMGAAASFLSAYPAWNSPLTNATNGADFSVFMGALFGGGVYFLLSRKSVAAEADATTDAEPVLA